MSRITAQRCFFLVALVGGKLTFWCTCTLAQITPDTTLRSNSTVELDGNTNTFNINGGTTAGSNLFHSFGEFSVPNGNTAFFNNASNIQNIITRVTGGSVSNIDGTIRALGTANLFLINPNGIIFGPNASLNIGGSFLGSTASSFNFADGTHFSASTPQTTTLLTISIPLGLQFGFLPGNIENRSVATNSSNTTVGLSVAPGRTLALVGGNVQSSGGLLQAPNGQIQLGGVAEPTTVGLEVNNSNFSVKLPKEIPKADVSLNNSAVIDVRDRGAGSVEVTARNIEILGGSRINAGIREGLTAVGSQVGDITLNATDAVRINQLSRIINSVAPNATGNAGNININAGEISITNLASEPALSTSPSGNGRGRSGDVSLVTTGSIFVTGQDVNPGDTVISTFSGSRGLGTGNISLQANGSISLNNAFFVTSNFGRGTTGSISVQGKESVSLVNNSSLASAAFERGNSGDITILSEGPILIQDSLVNTAVGRSDRTTTDIELGNGGNITITGRSVSITNGTEISARMNNGVNSAGDIKVTATDFVEVSGAEPLELSPEDQRGDRSQSIIYSALLTTTELASSGFGGNIEITTPSLRLSDGGSLRAESRGNNRGGNITVNANNIDLTTGGQLLTTAFGAGDAGNINLNNINRITINGDNLTKAERFNQIAQASGIRQANFILGSANSTSGVFANTSETSTGGGGNVNITTGELLIGDEAQMRVSSEGTGIAGNLAVNARSIRLENNAILNADTRSNSTNPEQEQATITLNSRDFVLLRDGSQITTNATGTNVIGGNININTDFLIALENSDISADSNDAQGGRVTINAINIFGTQPRNTQTLQSDITARGASPELTGILDINSTIVDFSLGLVELPSTLADASSIIDTACAAFSGEENSEFIVTGRGGLPSNPYEPLATYVVWFDTRMPTIISQQPSKTSTPLPSPGNITRIRPARGWVFNNKGEVTLISHFSHENDVKSSACRL